MPYIEKRFKSIKGKRVEDFLQEVTTLKKDFIISLLDKSKVLDQNKKVLKKAYKLKDGYVCLYLFEAQTRNLKPLFQTEHFAIFDKPSHLLVHPTSISSKYTLLDEIRHYLGEEASLVHRIDAETSGLVLVSKNPYSDMVLKKMFEEKQYNKTYQALVEGKIIKSFEINEGIKSSNSMIKLKMTTSKDGKESKTIILPISYNKQKNQSLIEAKPITGRQHQIRVHLNSKNHRIVGDPIYGLEEEFVNNFLNKKISQEKRKKVTGESRLMLHANSLSFNFLGLSYTFTSKQNIFTKENLCN